MSKKKNKSKPELLGSMTSYLNLASKCAPQNKGVKRLWFKGLVYLKQAVTLQKESEIDKMLNKRERIELIPELHKYLEEKFNRPIQMRLITQLCKDGQSKKEIEEKIQLAVETFDGKIEYLVPSCIKM